MKAVSLFSIHLTIIVIFLIIILILAEVACWVLKKIDERRNLGKRAKKWIYVLDWLDDEDDEKGE